MLSVMRVLVVFALCLAVVIAQTATQTQTNIPTTTLPDNTSPLQELEGSTESTISVAVRDAEETVSSTVFAEPETTPTSSSTTTTTSVTSPPTTSASSFIVASTLAMPLLPAFVLGY